MYAEHRDDQNNLISYIRKSDDAIIPLDESNKDYKAVLKWIESGGLAESDSEILDKVKIKKIEEYKIEGVKRIKSQVSEWNTYDKISFLASYWNLLKKSSANASQANAVAIYQYVKNAAIPNVNAQTTVEAVLSIDVINDAEWPH